LKLVDRVRHQTLAAGRAKLQTEFGNQKVILTRWFLSDRVSVVQMEYAVKCWMVLTFGLVVQSKQGADAGVYHLVVRSLALLERRANGVSRAAARVDERKLLQKNNDALEIPENKGFI
jgi:hypothetical protein